VTIIRFVLFTSSVESSLQPLSDAWAQLAASYADEPLQIIHGVVDVADDHHLAERFRVSNVPSFLLFRNRKVGEIADKYACWMMIILQTGLAVKSLLICGCRCTGMKALTLGLMP
jgi:hypothetical protein